MAQELKVIQPDQRVFDANGKRYHISETISFARYQKAQELIIQAGYGAGFSEIFVNLRKAYDMLNASKPADAAVIIYNIMYGITELEKKKNPALMLSALYVNYEGEDMTDVDENRLQAKIDDWAMEYDVSFFYSLGINIIPGLIPAYEIASKDFSQKINLKKEKQNTFND